MSLTKIDITKQAMHVFDLLAKDWMLISAGTEEKWNTMTASWGGVGVIWGKPSVTAYIRHSRYTKEFVDNSEYFTITFLQDGHRDALNTLGSKSGREIDKMHESGLTPVFVEGQPTFEEAKLVLVCRKRCKSEIAPEDILQQETIDKWYGDHDFHTMYIGEIVAAYQG
ncbi:flavin reductase family protein [Agathobaculum sp. NTUH-O15-33]|uniref:flavin reductase family protein n=1 Tax=Agathobaculum sp. NTUH-O15-33 TaxID=3079302 RepID=UPI0029584DCA|nr:flavin reductase family protein [Agathobaculum sp. NTUH-O15-33]WNX84138.1 flavin reductase family protein [Agathobaculum sp. NTUH-O15-33]